MTRPTPVRDDRPRLRDRAGEALTVHACGRPRLHLARQIEQARDQAQRIGWPVIVTLRPDGWAPGWVYISTHRRRADCGHDRHTAGCGGCDPDAVTEVPDTWMAAIRAAIQQAQHEGSITDAHLSVRLAPAPGPITVQIATVDPLTVGCAACLADRGVPCQPTGPHDRSSLPHAVRRADATDRFRAVADEPRSS